MVFCSGGLSLLTHQIVKGEYWLSIFFQEWLSVFSRNGARSFGSVISFKHHGGGDRGRIQEMGGILSNVPDGAEGRRWEVICPQSYS